MPHLVLEPEVKNSWTNLQYGYFTDNTEKLEVHTFSYTLHVISGTKIDILGMVVHEIHLQGHSDIQRQLSRGVLIKRRSEKM